MSAELGLVYATRDDDYANGVNERLVRSITSFQRLARQRSTSIDVVIVDWNSPPSGDLYGFLASKGIANVRIVSVGPRLAKMLAPSATKVFSEYPAKNLGLLHVDADQVLVLNPDITIDAALFEACIARPYLGDSFLRADRTDFRWTRLRRRVPLRRHVRHGVSQKESVSLLPSRMGYLRGGTTPLNGEEIIDGFIVSPPGGVESHFLAGMHTNASGDFICTGKENWLRAGGFAQDRWMSVMGDAIMIARLLSCNLRQVVHSGAGLWHEDHPQDPTRGGTWSADMWPDFLKELLATTSSLQSPLESTVPVQEVPSVRCLGCA